MQKDASDPMVIIIATFLCLQFLPTAISSNCSITNNSACPRFSSSLSFPFASSSTKGCGHPAFQLDCLRSLPLLTINNCSFSPLPHQRNNQTISLALQDCDGYSINTSSGLGISYCELPLGPINLSASPFRFSSSSCSRLSSLRPCDTDALDESSPPLGSSCSLTPWQRQLLRRPSLLLHGCPYTANCSRNTNVPDDIRKFLKMGIEIEWDEDDPYFRHCSDCRLRDGVCGFNDSDARKPFLCFQGPLHSSPIQWPIRDANEEAKKKIIIGICGIVVSLCFLLVTLLIVLAFGYICGDKWKRKRATSDDGFLLRRLQYSTSKSNLLSHPQSLPATFTYEELESSTNCFDCKRKLGDGGFGSVYLGQLSDGRMVAVKKLYKDIHQHERQRAKKASSFANEILILSSLDHPNLVRLHGYCTDPRGLLLVYEFVSNGTLADHLHGHRRQYSGGLSWRVRLSIATQIACALEYLHFGVNPPIVHRDVTSSNIFLTKDFTMKVGDFGLSRLLPMRSGSSSASSSVWTGPQGTPGYLDPDYHRSFILTEKSDVYSFGVVLLELISGKKAVDTKRDRREMGLADLMVSKIQMGSLMEMVDEDLACGGGGTMVAEMVKMVAELAFRCVAGEKDDRPNMREVVDQLKRITTTMEP